MTACATCGWDHETRPIVIVGDLVTSKTYGKGVVERTSVDASGCQRFEVRADDPDGRLLIGIPSYGWTVDLDHLDAVARQIPRASTTSLLMSFLDIANDRVTEWLPALRWASPEARLDFTSRLRAEIDRRIPVPKAASRVAEPS